MPLKYALSHGVEKVLELLTDPDFLVERSMALGELSVDCEVEEGDNKVVVNLNRTVNRELPSIFAKLFDSKQTLQMEEEWDIGGDDKCGKYTIKVVGQPVVVTAKFKLSPTPEGSEYSIEHSCKAKIPLLSGKIEKFVVAQTADGVSKEIAYLKERLGQ